MLDQKQHLTIALTEPVVFLRSSDPSGRLAPGSSDPPALVRGILTFDVVKPVVISSIEVELTGLLAIYQSEGVVSRHAEPLEKHKVYSSIATVFRADPSLHGRRPASLGPGSSATRHDNGTAITPLRRPSPSRRDSECRSTLSVPPDLGPTPPYTRVAQPPIIEQTTLRSPIEDPSQTSEEPRRALSDNSEGQAHRNGLAAVRPPPTANSSPHITAHSNVSSESLYQPSEGNNNDTTISNHNTAEDSLLLSHRGQSPSRPSRVHTPEDASRIRPPSSRSSHDHPEARAGRSHLRFSLSSVLDAFAHKPRIAAGSVERERGRPRDRILIAEQSGSGTLVVGDRIGDEIASVLDGGKTRSNASHLSVHTEHRERHLLGLGRLLGLERVHTEEKPKEHCREFAPGTYSYPISFLIPPDLPPSFTVPHGSLTYAIKGVAHRPGTFTSKFSCQVPLSVVAAPALGAENNSPGESGPLFIEKQWEDKFAYTFALSSRLFLLSPRCNLGVTMSEAVHRNARPLQAEAEVRTEAEYGTATLDLTLLPLEKIKIWKFGVFVDQRVCYTDEEGLTVREDDKRRIRLLEVQDICPAEEIASLGEEPTHNNKHENSHDQPIPLAPTPLSPHRSPLLQYLPPSTDPSTLAGPGPYILSANLRLPDRDAPSGQDGGLSFTVKHKSSSIRVAHSLRVVLRVERVDEEQSHDHNGEKKKMFDVAVQTPITILSYDSIPEYQMPPTYCEFMEDTSQTCHSSIEGFAQDHEHGHEAGHDIDHIVTPSSTSSLSNAGGAGHSHHLADEHRRDHDHGSFGSSSHARGNSHPNLLLLETPLHSRPPSPAGELREAGPSHARRQARHQHRHSRSASYTVSTFHIHTHPHSTPVSTPLTSRPPSPVSRYERLVSGQESEAGEAPPSYESVSSISE